VSRLFPFWARGSRDRTRRHTPHAHPRAQCRTTRGCGSSWPRTRGRSRLPGLGGLPGDTAVTQDAPQCFPTDLIYDLVVDQVVAELGQRPRRKRLLQEPGVTPGDRADPSPGRIIDRPGCAPAPFWVQCGKPLLVESVDDLPHVLLRARHQMRDVGNRLALGRGQHNDRPPELDGILRGPTNPLQTLPLGHADRPNEHLRTTRHTTSTTTSTTPHSMPEPHETEINNPANVHRRGTR